MNQFNGYIVHLYDETKKKQTFFCRFQEDVVDTILNDPEGRSFMVFRSYTLGEPLGVANSEVMNWCFGRNTPEAPRLERAICYVDGEG